MDNLKVEITLKCLFCDKDLLGMEGKEYLSGDLIDCTNCTKPNDYDSVYDIALKEAESQLLEKVLEEGKKILKF